MIKISGRQSYQAVLLQCCEYGMALSIDCAAKHSLQYYQQADKHIEHVQSALSTVRS